MLTLTIMTSDLVLDSTRTWMQEYNKPVQGGVGGCDGRVNISHGLQDGDDWIPYISPDLVHLKKSRKNKFRQV